MLNLQTYPALEPKVSDSRTDFDARLLAWICERPPYFALQGARSPRPGVALAWVAPEQPLGPETGPIAAAEVGRHLAILGSLAVASCAADSGQRYYLATAARFERACGTQPLPTQRLVAEAKSFPSVDSERTVKAVCELRTPSGVSTHRLQVEYLRLTARVFERTFRARPQPSSTTGRNPHAEPLLLTMAELDSQQARATVRFDAEQCAGHFDGCPAVPIARLMQGLASIAGRLFQHRLADSHAPYVVLRGDVRSHKLAFAGELLTLHAEHATDLGDTSALRCRATLEDGSSVGELHLWLAPARQ